MSRNPAFCAKSPTGTHVMPSSATCCHFCHRTASYLLDLGWNVPAHDPDWCDQEADVNDAPSTDAAQLLR